MSIHENIFYKNSYILIEDINILAARSAAENNIHEQLGKAILGIPDESHHETVRLNY